MILVSQQADGNMSYSCDPANVEEVRENRRRFLGLQGIGLENVVVPSIPGGDNVVLLTEADRGRCLPHQEDLPEGDIFLVSSRQLYLGILLGDCMGAMLLDPVHEVFAGFHSGWRGVMQMSVPRKTVLAMQEHFATTPADLVVEIAPFLQKKSSYFPNVNEEIFSRGGYQAYVTTKDEGFLVDWGQRAVDDLVAAGVSPHNISCSNVDTLTSGDYFSHRLSKEKSISDSRFIVVFGYPEHDRPRVEQPRVA